MEERYRINDNLVIWNDEDDVWSIIILPELIQIDNWHGYPHIHINKERKKISLNNSYKVFLKVMSHIEYESNVNLNKLLEELR
ncbi:MAG: hypothetical protein FWE58_03220 [Methanobrevibacter sp.]|nr:hypothetical protein [Methanobrevibacter sp.]